MASPQVSCLLSFAGAPLVRRVPGEFDPELKSQWCNL